MKECTVRNTNNKPDVSGPTGSILPDVWEVFPPPGQTILLRFLCGWRRDLVLVSIRAMMLRLDAVSLCRDDAFGLVLAVLPLVQERHEREAILAASRSYRSLRSGPNDLLFAALIRLLTET